MFAMWSVNAALANGAMIHLLDFDDEIAGSGIHPSAIIFPVVMALAEMNGDTLVRMVPYKHGKANRGHSCVKGRFAYGYAHQ